MKMEAVPSGHLYCDDDKKSLEKLLDIFGSVVSLEDISSSYCEAGRNLRTACEKLCKIQNRTCGSSVFTSDDEPKDSSTFSGLSPHNIFVKPISDRHLKLSKKKKCPTSMGTVSGTIGKEYAKHRSLPVVPCEAAKPPKISLDESIASKTWEEIVKPDFTEMDKTIQQGMEDFLYKMLGDGFQLQRNVILEVLGVCGFDMEKSIEKLLDISAQSLGKKDNVLSTVPQNQEEKCPYGDSCQAASNNTDSVSSSQVGDEAKRKLNFSSMDKDRHDLQKELLESLFRPPEIFEEPIERTQAANPSRRLRSFGQVVVEPPREIVIESRTVTSISKVPPEENESNEDNYDALRKAVTEYRSTMKEYYKSAANAFAEGKHAQSEKLMEEGHFFKEKAREADEKSTKILIETKTDDMEEVSFDLRDHEPKEAIRFLKLNLLNLCGIPSIQCLKLIVGNEEDIKGARKKLIKKLLERESIAWTEEDNGQIIVIRVDKINPKRLSFTKKK